LENIPYDHLINKAARINVANTVKDIIASSSDIIRQKISDGNLIVAGAIYDVDTGKIAWI
jgi:carbonic anhydrase